MNINRRQFVATAAAAGAALAAGSAITGCGGGEKKAPALDKMTFVWEPNESTSAYDGMRDAVAKEISAGAGIPCDTMTTTDYNVTIESLASGKAHMASLGASEYVEVHAQNPAVEIAFVLSNDKGELDQASYWAQVCVKKADEDKYKENGEYVLKDLKGKNFSFVSLSSTSGFVIPAVKIKNDNNLESTDVVSESGAFFDTVLFPGSHPGSLANLLSGDADLAVFADYLTTPFLEEVGGEHAQPGCTYKVLKDQDAPLDKFAGDEFVVVASFPVPAVPICINTEAVPAETVKAIIDHMCSDEVAANPELFPTPEEAAKGVVSNWTKTTDKVRFVPADDTYFDAFREMIDFKAEK